MIVVCVALLVYWLVLLARIILSWLPAVQSSPSGRGVFEVVWNLTEPVLRPVRGLLPPLRLGMVGLDLSPIIIFILIGILRGTLC